MADLRPDSDPAIAALARDLDRARASSYPLTFAVRRLAADPVHPAAACDALAVELGYQGLGDHWVEIPRRIAVKLLTHLIGGDLAYPVQVVPPAQAQELARRVLDLVPGRARYFTNGAISGDFALYDINGQEVLGWRSISAAMFDNGLIIVGDERIVFLWAETSA
ncbi:MAG: hypothetical protein RMK84_03535 [Oscillochloridaceae bacterium]|nr:hypothetical protein [Chloroflexaceae bacterium]MDW8389177.1 hypothetical protein [Oscillochloridaceae bacterium]